MFDPAEHLAALNVAWRSFVEGDIVDSLWCVGTLVEELCVELVEVQTRSASGWSIELDDALDFTLEVGRLASQLGAFELEIKVMTRIAEAANEWADTNDAALWYLIASEMHYAKVEELRGQPFLAHRRLDDLRTRADSLHSADDGAQGRSTLLESLDSLLARLEERLGHGPPLDHRAEPNVPEIDGSEYSDRMRRRGSEEDRDDHQSVTRLPESDEQPFSVSYEWEQGQHELAEFVDEAWGDLAAGRRHLDAHEYEQSLLAYNIAFRTAERMSASFRGAWYARSCLAHALLGRARCLHKLGFSEEAARDARTAVGVLEDQLLATPEVLDLLVDHSVALSVLSWITGKQDQTGTQALDAALQALSDISKLKVDGLWQPNLLISEIWLERQASFELRKHRRFKELWQHTRAATTIMSEFVINDPESSIAKDAEVQLYSGARFPFGLVQRLAFKAMKRAAPKPDGLKPP
jgi:tetratricopeptide (TPR) repeat protein